MGTHAPLSLSLFLDKTQETHTATETRHQQKEGAYGLLYDWCIWQRNRHYTSLGLLSKRTNETNAFEMSGTTTRRRTPAEAKVRLEQVDEKLEKLAAKSVALRSWIVVACFPFIMTFESALEEYTSYHLPTVPWDRVVWVIAWSAGSIVLAILVSIGIYATRLQWNFLVVYDEESRDEYFERLERHLGDDFSSFEFAMSWFPLIWFLPFVLLNVLMTELNNFYNPPMSYQRIVNLWVVVGVLGFATIVVLLGITYLHHTMVHPRRHVQRSALLAERAQLVQEQSPENLELQPLLSAIATTTTREPKEREEQQEESSSRNVPSSTSPLVHKKTPAGVGRLAASRRAQVARKQKTARSETFDL